MIDQSPSILLVDDDADICQNMADILGFSGYHVDIALGGHAALELLHQRPYDIALLDLKMPDMDGLSLYKEIKKIWAGMVTLLVTAYAGETTTREALSAGFREVLPKPIDLTKLLKLLSEAMKQPLVLIVDDDSELCNQIWFLLNQEGYRVCIAHDAKQATERLRGSTQIVLIDVDLPDRHGADVFRDIKTRNPETRVVVVTSLNSHEEIKVQELLAEGADAVCHKPFDFEELLCTLGSLAAE